MPLEFYSVFAALSRKAACFMTFEELNKVRVLKEKIIGKEIRLQALRDAAESITPKYKRDSSGNKSFTALDVSPHGNFAGSKVDNLTALIIDGQKELADIYADFEKAQFDLTQIFRSQISSPFEQTILIYRYVSCYSLTETAKKMHFSPGYVYRLHRRILKKRFGIDYPKFAAPDKLDCI